MKGNMMYSSNKSVNATDFTNKVIKLSKCGH